VRRIFIGQPQIHYFSCDLPVHPMQGQ